MHAPPYPRPDVDRLIEDLASALQPPREPAQLTLYGEPAPPQPVLHAAGHTLRGRPVAPEALRPIEPAMYEGPVYAVDAGAKILLDLGAYKVVEAKVAAAEWRGASRTRTFGPVKRIRLFADLSEAAQWLAAIEAEAAARYARHSPGSLVLLDRPMAAPRRGAAGRAFRLLLSRTWRVVGVAKTSRIRLTTGEGLLSYLQALGDERLPGRPWLYHPVFPGLRGRGWALGDVAVARLSPFGPAFRVDIDWRLLDRVGCEAVAGWLAGMQDPAAPGYPYPLRAVHQMSRIGREELELDRMLLMERLERAGLGAAVRNAAAAVAYKKRYIWGEGV